MTRRQTGERPVSDEEFETMPERIGRHFERVRELLAERTEDADSDR